MYSKKIKTIAQLLTVVCLVAFALSTNSCKKLPKEEYFRIKIDSITYEGVTLDGFIYTPTAVRVDDSVVIRLHGYIGPNQCYVFDPEKDIVLYFPSFPESKKGIFEIFGKKIDNDTCIRGEESILNHVIILVFKEEDPEDPDVGTTTYPGVYTFYDYIDPDIKLLEITVRE